MNTTRHKNISDCGFAVADPQFDQCLPSIGNSIASSICSELGWPSAEAPNEKSAFAALLAVTVTCMGFSVPLAPPSCQATTVYLPGGTPLIVKLPSSAETAKNGCFKTPM